jgi:hypothetical protein
MSFEHSSARQGGPGHMQGGQETPEALDLLLGAKNIAAFMGVTPRQVYYWHAMKRFSFFNIGDLIAARKSTIVEELKKFEFGSASKNTATA